MSKLITRREAADLVPDNGILATATFGLGGLPEDLLVGIKERYEEVSHPKDITFMWSCGIGNNTPGRGADHLLADGLVKRILAGHVGSSPGMVEKISKDEIEAYLLPQGVYTQWYRQIASNKPMLTKVGLKTYVDPRFEGAKSTSITNEEIIEVIELGNEEYLLFPDLNIDIAFIRGSYADENGNLVINEETCKLEQLELAMATHKKGGKVIAQVKDIVEKGSLNPKDVYVPGALIDHIVIADLKYHQQTMGTEYSKKYSNEIRVPISSDIEKTPLTIKKLMGRRAAMELFPNAIVNFGIGTPDQVSAVSKEEGIDNLYTATLEMGLWGGNPTGGLDFGASLNAEASIPMANQFDFYDGNGLDLTVLGIGQIDEKGNNNVTKFGKKVPGPGGFINISQNTKNIVFVGTFTIGSRAHFEDGRLVIEDQGKGPKFVKNVQQISFSGEYAKENNQNVLYITERAVFDLYEGKVRLIEIAPGVDIKTDILDLMEFEPIISDEVKEMNPDIFKESWGGLSEYIFEKEN